MRISTTALAVLVASSTLVLAGCGNVVEDAVNNAVEQGVEQAIEGGSGEDIDIDAGLDGSASAPESFPDGFPLPPGNPTSAFAAGNVWSLTYSIDSESAYMDLNSWYESNGYELVAESDLGELKSWIWQTDEYSATVGILDDSGALTLNYSLTIRE